MSEQPPPCEHCWHEDWDDSGNATCCECGLEATLT